MYIEIAQGGALHQGTAIPKDSLLSFMKRAVEQGTELYQSMFEYEDKILEHMLSGRKSASGFIGNCYITRLVLDIDKGKESDKNTLWRARVFTEKLLNDWKLDEDEIQYWHSGTGYHLVIPDIFGFTPAPDLPDVVKATLDEYFPEVDTKFYHKAGLIRVGYTINLKSSRYKTPLSYEEFMSSELEDIFKLAAESRLDFKYPITLKKSIGKFRNLIKLPKIEPNSKSLVMAPTKVVSCVQHMFNLGEEEGTRHDRIMRITSAWRRAGLPLQAIVKLMQDYAPSMDKYEVEKHVTDVYKAGYQWGCEDKSMKQFCDPQCIYHKNKDYAPAVLNSSMIEAEYAKFIKTDFSGQAFNLADFIEMESDFVVYPGYFMTIIGDTGLNKGVRLDELLPTPNGYRYAGDIKEGDYLMDNEGLPTLVKSISPVHNKPNFKITFDDSASIIVDDDHLWEVNYKTRANTQRVTNVKSTKWLYEHGVKNKQRRKFSIRLTEPVQYNKKELLIDPYILGLWLGDGSSSKACFTTQDKELLTAFEDKGYKVKYVSKYDYSISNGLVTQLKQLNLLGNKHIPSDYLTSSVEDRIALLQGLMDTDGCPIKKSNVFAQSNKVIVDNFVELLNSLGIKASVTSKIPILNGKECKRAYRVTFSAPFPIYRLRSKQIKQSFRTNYPQVNRRYIDSIKPVESAPTVCFTVDSKDSLYLASNQYIVTHNTAFLQNLAVQLKEYSTLYISTEFGNLLLYRRFIQIAHNYTKEEVDAHYSQHSNTLGKAIKHIHFLKSVPNIEELDKLIAKFNPRIVMIDTIDDIMVPGEKQGTGKDELLAMDLKQIAERRQCIIMGVHHIRKSDAVDDEGTQKRLTVHSGKGSGSFSQKPDVVIGIEGDRTKSRRLVTTLKSRDAAPFKAVYDVNMDTFIFNQVRRDAT